MDTYATVRPLPPITTLLRHTARAAGVGAMIVITALAIGTLGYHWLEHLSWLDAELNASMILTGMGPVDHVHTPAGKVFASVYALFAGLAFLSTAGLIFTPLAKRTLHSLHLDMHEARQHPMQEHSAQP